MNEEIMIAVYQDMRIACPEEEMLLLKKKGWKIVNIMNFYGEKRYTMALPQKNESGHPIFELNPIQRFVHYLLPAVSHACKIA